MSEAVAMPIFRDPLGPRASEPSFLGEEESDRAYRSFRAGGMWFALQDEVVVEWQTLEGEEVGRTLRDAGLRALPLESGEIPLCPLEDLLPDWLEGPCAPPIADQVEVLIVEVGGERLAVIVEQVDDPVELDFEPTPGTREGSVLGAKVVPHLGVLFILDAAEMVRRGGA